jgi:hypothetical protein
MLDCIDVIQKAWCLTAPDTDLGSLAEEALWLLRFTTVAAIPPLHIMMHGS